MFHQFSIQIPIISYVSEQSVNKLPSLVKEKRRKTKEKEFTNKSQKKGKQPSPGFNIN
jgi:hypothetical protein